MKRRFMGSKHKDAGYMKVVALEDGLTVSFSKPLEYSFDEITWQSLPANTQTPAINKDQYVAFRANNLTPTYSSGIGTFSIDKQCDLKGNCMSLLFGDEFSDKVDLSKHSYAFYKLFYNQSNIKSVDPGFLPATMLFNSCYSSMFQGCTSLTTAPELPATLSTSCYRNMFNGCTSLTKAPELPATTAPSGCYRNMFKNCTSLTTAPKLPATALDGSCYSSMFYGCTNLTTAPELPATRVFSFCYQQMFQNCTNLTTAPELPATTLATYCYDQMFKGCTSLTAAPELPATKVYGNCYSGMFNGCTGLITAPELPATTLADSCYYNMFNGCASLTAAPALPATTLDSSCYRSMFKGCTSLTTAPTILPATTLASSCYQQMFSDCTSLTTTPELPATTLADNCCLEMFCRCTNLTTAPTILPATTLAVSCYSSMFMDCTNLTTAPELPATTLINGCYRNMFSDCDNLNYIKALFTTTPDPSYTESWVWSVSSTGTFIKSKDATWDVTGQNGVPTGWTVEIESDDQIDYEFVDLGLPSGTKWSTRNLGASNVNDVGLYYQNGGEQGYKVVLEPGRGSYNIVSTEPAGFDFSTYSISEFKDAANIINKDMSIPSVEDWNELVNNGTFAYNGTNTVYTSNINGNTIIFPQNLVLKNGLGIDSTMMFYITFSIHATNAFCIYDHKAMGPATEGIDDLLEFQIQSGMPIRPVKKVG